MPSNIRKNKVYFHLSFGPKSNRFWRFGYMRIWGKYYLCLSDLSLWKKFELFDSGWGNCDGLMRNIKLSCEDLLNVFFSSWLPSTLSIPEKDSNRYGAASLLVEQYFEEVVHFFYSILQDTTHILEKEYFEGIGFLFYDKTVRMKVQKKSDEQKKMWNTLMEYVERFLATNKSNTQGRS